MNRIFLYVLVGALVLIAGGFAGWYVYLHAQQQAVVDTDTARGLSIEPPTLPVSTGTPIRSAPQTASTTPTPRPVARLSRVESAPVAGFAFSEPATSTASSTYLFFVARASGYVFEFDTATQRKQRLTNTLMPKVYEAFLVPSKNGVILRRVETDGSVSSYAGQFASTTSSTSTPPFALLGRYLQKNIRDILVDKKSGSLTYLVTNATTHGASLWSEEWNGTKQKQLFTSGIAGWQIHKEGGRVAISQSPADIVPGYAYTLAANGTLSPFLGPFPGLNILLDPSGTNFLYSSSEGRSLALFGQVGKSTAFIPLETVVDKCVWAPGKTSIAYCAAPSQMKSSAFLNEWYRGLVHTSDAWWKIDTSTGAVTILYTMPENLDVQNPRIDTTGNYIGFLNGGDQSLWLLRVTN